MLFKFPVRLIIQQSALCGDNSSCDLIVALHASLQHVLYHVASDEIISGQIKKMEMGFKRIKEELKRHKPQDADDKFAPKMKDFITKSEERFRRATDQHKLMEEKFKEIVSYYCLDTKTSMEEFFGDLSHFLKEFEVCLLYFFIVYFLHHSCIYLF